MYLKYYADPGESEYRLLLERKLSDDENLRNSVREILEDVRTRGDDALREYEERFDSSRLDSFYVSEAEFDEAEALVPQRLKDAIEIAYRNILAFHEAQKPQGECVETMNGVRCWRKIVPVSRVGLYVPGGTAPLFSTVLMLAIPARAAGCGSLTLATPAKEERVNPAVLYAARRCGVDNVLKLGGAQAIAAMAYGTQTIGKVDKIFGPGNRYVTFAKSIVSSFCAIDMLAGPSEVMVVCDASSDPVYVACDLLSQAEHGRDSQVILMIRAEDEKEAEKIYGKVEAALDDQIAILGRHEYMLPSLSHSCAIAVHDDDKLMRIVNEYAPEHLILNCRNYRSLASRVESAGSVFLGPYSPESAGDYASGTNHTLPTSAWARSSSGVSLDSFIKKITMQELTEKGLRSLSDAVVTMAEAEDLMAHSQAVKVRLK